jgi:hypothetical protein
MSGTIQIIMCFFSGKTTETVLRENALYETQTILLLNVILWERNVAIFLLWVDVHQLSPFTSLNAEDCKNKIKSGIVLCKYLKKFSSS